MAGHNIPSMAPQLHSAISHADEVNSAVFGPGLHQVQQYVVLNHFRLNGEPNGAPSAQRLQWESKKAAMADDSLQT